MFKIGIIGDTGMVGQELTKVIKMHNCINIVYRKNSTREEGQLIDCDLIFLATKDADSMNLVEKILPLGIKIIDMSGAFRLSLDNFEKWYGMKHTSPELINAAVYGMPALFPNSIAKAMLVANPGCYATSVILAVKPLVGLIEKEISIVSTSGNSGARRDIEDISNEITYSYGRKHKHVPEMEYYSGFNVDFTPIVIRSVFKGINTNIRATLSKELKDLPDDEAAMILEYAIRDTYTKEDRIIIVHDNKDLIYGTKDVNDTHDLLIKVRVDEGKVFINALLDNLMKGAASQGVENMNIMLGIPRLMGINI